MESVLKVLGECLRQRVHPGPWNPLTVFDTKGLNTSGPMRLSVKSGASRHDMDMDMDVLVERMLSELGHCCRTRRAHNGWNS